MSRELAKKGWRFLTPREEAHRRDPTVHDDGTPTIEFESPTTSRMFGRYELREEIGHGGMGEVYRAYDTSLKRDVAIKLLKEHGGKSASMRFFREARLIAQLQHPNIVGVYEVGISNRRPFIAMELVEGATLHGRLDKLGLTERIRVLQRVAEGVAHAHEHDIVHRDLKPSNILLGEDGVPRVADFGLAKETDATTMVTASGVIMGTPQYMAPEQVRGERKEMGSWTDVYSLGVMLYEALTGTRPYDGEELAGICNKVLQGEAKPPRKLDPSLSPELEAICLKAMDPEIRRRYLDAGEFANELSRWLSGESVLARPVGMMSRAFRKAKKNRVVVGVAAAGILGVGIALGVFVPKWFDAEKRFETEREYVLKQLRITASQSLDGALALRRVGQLQEMGTFLPGMEEACRIAIERAPESAEPHYHLGRMYRALMMEDAALEQQNIALSKDPNFARSLYERAILNCRLYSERAQLLNQKRLHSLGLRHLGEQMFRNRGFRAIRLGIPSHEELERSDKRFRDLRQIVLRDLEMLNQIEGIESDKVNCVAGTMAYLNGEYATAEERLVEAIAQNPRLEVAYVVLSEMAVLQGDDERAIEWCRLGHEIDEGYLEHLFNRCVARLGLCYARRQRGEDGRQVALDALDDLDQLAALDPTGSRFDLSVPNILSMIGFYQDSVGVDPDPAYSRALAAFDRVIENAPENLWFRVWRGITRSNWAVAKEARGQDPLELFRDAEADFSAVIEQDASNSIAILSRADVRMNWADHLLDHGEDPSPLFQSVIEDCTLIFTIEPDDLRALNTRAYVYVKLGNLDMSTGRDPEHWYQLAITDANMLIQQDDKFAHPYFLRASAKGHLWLFTLFERGELVEDLFKDAMADLEKVEQLDPDLARARILRADLRTSWGAYLYSTGQDADAEFEAAVQDYDRVLDRYPHNFKTRRNRAQAFIQWGQSRLMRGSDPGEFLRDAITDLDFVLAIDIDAAEVYMLRHLGRVRADPAHEPPLQLPSWIE